MPAEYRATRTAGAVVWERDGSAAVVAALVGDVLATLQRLLAHRLARALHVVVYATNDEARRALDRSIAPSALLAPLHTPELALIAAQAPAADARNGDRERMRLQLCHELAHVFSAERTGSVKRLGDGGHGMRLPSWLDEGFAVNVAAAATGRSELVDAAIAAAAHARISDEQLATAFADLSSPDRERAFAVATAHVARDVRAHGLATVFARLAATSCSRGARCGGG